MTEFLHKVAIEQNELQKTSK